MPHHFIATDADASAALRRKGVRTIIEQGSRSDQAGARRIPRTVVQLWLTGELPAVLAANRDRMAGLNPGWRFQLYDESSVRDYIRDGFGQDVLDTYLLIDDAYGPAKADLFRYLRIFAEGGVYLDVKSTLTRPLDEVLRPDDAYILSHWRNGPGEEHQGFGFHRDLAAMPRGEFQQWHVMAEPGHPFLQAVVDRVLANIRTYSVWRHGVGKPGVLRTTGPIAYSQAIAPMVASHPHRLLTSEDEVGLVYSIGDGYRHNDHFKRHYSMLGTPVVKLPPWRRPSAWVYGRLRNLKQRLVAK